jgi:4-amino-4-deoxychorismate lyase
MKSPTTVLVNGEAQDHVSIQDRGFQFGDGVFETLAVCADKPLLWERHLQRLFEGCARLRIKAPSQHVLRREAEQLCVGVRRAVLKLVVTRGSSERGYALSDGTMPTRVLALRPWPSYPEKAAQSGVDVCLCRRQISRNPQLAGIKHLNRLEQVLARAEWQREFAEGLMFDDTDRLIEGTASNVFVVSHGTLLTPDLSESGVAGVMRALVLEYAEAAALPCKITGITRSQLDAAEEIFLSNSLIGIWPVRRVESRIYEPGEVTRRVQRGTREYYCLDEAD